MTHRYYSRRQILTLAAGFAAFGSVIARVSGVADAQQKVSKEMVEYRGSPKDGHRCSGCSNFLPPHSCRVVSGEISSHGWCTIWTPR